MPDNISKLGAAVISSTSSNTVRIITGKYVGSETVDPNLSKVLMTGGETARWVPKWKHVGSMAVNDTVWMISDGNSYVIAGIEIGNRNLANAGM